MKRSKLFLIDLTLMLNFVVVCFYGNHYYHCYSILPPVHSKLMSHYQLSNFAIYGLEHSETDMNS